MWPHLREVLAGANLAAKPSVFGPGEDEGADVTVANLGLFGDEVLQLVVAGLSPRLPNALERAPPIALRPFFLLRQKNTTDIRRGTLGGGGAGSPSFRPVRPFEWQRVALERRRAGLQPPRNRVPPEPLFERCVGLFVEPFAELVRLLRRNQEGPAVLANASWFACIAGTALARAARLPTPRAGAPFRPPPWPYLSPLRETLGVSLSPSGATPRRSTGARLNAATPRRRPPPPRPPRSPRSASAPGRPLRARRPPAPALATRRRGGGPRSRATRPRSAS